MSDETVCIVSEHSKNALMGPVLLDNCMHIVTKGVKWICQGVSSDFVTTNSILGPSVIKGVDGQRVGSMNYRVDCSKYNVHNGTHSEFCIFFAHAWDWCLPEIMQEPTLHLSPPLFLFVGGEVLPATFSPPHLIVISTLLCLLSSSSSLPPLLPSSHLS